VIRRIKADKKLIRAKVEYGLMNGGEFSGPNDSLTEKIIGVF
jgi:hypothetical protein